ncbi:MAG: class I SAM-dependent methyltransferase [Promethearchaeota archaeon]
MGLKILKKENLFNRIISKLWLKDAYRKIERIEKFLNKEGKILDIGGGLGTVSYLLKKKGYDSKVIDVQDVSIFKDIQPLIYDGIKIPFNDNIFDIALILTVLHHTKSPEIILNEAKRVAKRIIIIEDIYNSLLQKYLTFLIDSFANFQFFNHPHSNKNHNEWIRLFKNLNLEVIEYRIIKTAPFVHQVTYLLKT